MGRIADGMGGFLNLNVTMKYQTFQVNNSREVERYNTVINKPSDFDIQNLGFVLNIEY
jgi:hypothetical protein